MPLLRLVALTTAAVLALLLPAGATPAPKPELPAPLAEDDAPLTAVIDPQGVSEPEHTEFVVEHLEIPTPHGIVRGDVWRPAVPEGVRVPVILTYTPYQALYSALAPNRASRAHDAVGTFFVPRGYARAVFDVVGTYGSDGCTDFGGLGERESGAALVDALGSMPWSSGRVGMIGASYDGTTAIAAAVEAPAHLATIVPQVAIDRWYDYMYVDGVRTTLEDNPSGLADPPVDSPTDYDLLYGVVPPPALALEDPTAAAALVAEHARPCDRVEHAERGHQTDPVYDAFWVERDYRALADRVGASVLIEGAWLDDNVKHWASTRFFEALQARPAPEDGSELPQAMLTIGQWSHSTSQFAFAQGLRHAWFDHHLLGLDTGVEHLPAVVTEDSAGGISTSDVWPPADVAPVHPTLGLAPGSTSGWRDVNLAQVEQVLTSGRCGPACATWAVDLTGPARIVGEPVVEVLLSAEATSTHVAPVLVDVSPTGTRTPIARSLLNTQVREGLDRLDPLVPGEPTSLRIPLWPVDHRLAPGHTLELVLASTNATWGASDTTAATVVVHEPPRLTVPVQAAEAG